MGEKVTRKVRLPRAPRRLLDGGRGHGLSSVGFARRSPELEAEVLDLKPAAAQGRRIVEEAGYATRVRFLAGDFRTADWGEEYDLVLLFTVLYNAIVDEARGVSVRARLSMAPSELLMGTRPEEDA